jgi:hypothetical protein
MGILLALINGVTWLPGASNGEGPKGSIRRDRVLGRRLARQRPTPPPLGVTADRPSR